MHLLTEVVKREVARSKLVLHEGTLADLGQHPGGGAYLLGDNCSLALITCFLGSAPAPAAAEPEASPAAAAEPEPISMMNAGWSDAVAEWR